jgi:hypothetical protein
LLLGYINPAGPLAVACLDTAAARSALKQHVAEPLGILPGRGCRCSLAINVNMATAVKDLLHERGDDPRGLLLWWLAVLDRFTPSCSGRAGISSVIIRRDASIFTAAGVIFGSAA